MELWWQKHQELWRNRLALKNPFKSLPPLPQHPIYIYIPLAPHMMFPLESLTQLLRKTHTHTQSFPYLRPALKYHQQMLLSEKRPSGRFALSCSASIHFKNTDHHTHTKIMSTAPLFSLGFSFPERNRQIGDHLFVSSEAERGRKELRGIDLIGKFKMLMSVLLWLSKTSRDHTNSQYEDHERNGRKVHKESKHIVV